VKPKNMGILNKTCLVLLFFGVSTAALSQVEFLPIPNIWSSQDINRRTNETNQDTLRLQLPFFEDFSTSEGIPDSSKWLNSQNVSISNAIGFDPPSIKVASLDGVNAQGSPYAASEIVDSVDALTSQVIELGNVPTDLLPTVYISFWWQPEGRAELPDSRDSLVLRFLNSDGEWINVWSTTGGRDRNTEIFNQEIFSIFSLNNVNNNFFHNNFQFSFQAYGNPSGAFDFWHLDYIFLDQNRSLSDTSYLDQTWTSIPTSIFGAYSALPLEHLRANPLQEFDSTSLSYINLQITDVGGQAVNVIGFIRDEDTQQNIDTLNLPGDDNPFEGGLITGGIYETITFFSNPARSAFIDEFIQNSTDSIERLTTIMILDPPDVNFLENDTVRFTHVLSDYYAYDDGTGEEAIRLDQAGGQLAMRYVSRVPDVLSAIQAYFPPSVSTSMGTIRFRVWDSDNGFPGNIIYEDGFDRTISSVASDSLNRFLTFSIDETNILDTFWVGYIQLSRNVLGVGYDRNNDQKDQIRINVGNDWEFLNPDDDVDPPGSLMLRPVFREGILTSTQNPILPETEEVVVYPNPSRGIFKIQGEFDALRVLKVTGEVMFESASTTQIDLSFMPNGIYLLQITAEGKKETKRIILSR